MNEISLTSSDRVLVLAVHPDDESLSAGGLIQQALAQGAEVRIIFLTDGDNNPWPQRFLERRWSIDATARRHWGQRRRGEAQAAVGLLGVALANVSFWHYPDQGLTSLLMAGGEPLIAQLSAEVCQWQPTVLVAPSGQDRHPDHSATAVLLSLALERTDSFRARSFTLLEYLVHASEGSPVTEEFQLSLSPGQIDRKRQAILQHATQMALSRGRFLAFATATESFAVSGPSVDPQHPVLAGCFAEGTLCLKLRHNVSPATLLLAAETSHGPIRKILRLFAGPSCTVLDGVSGEVQSNASLVRGPESDELFLPVEPQTTARSLFFKVVARRWSFYDRSGWSPVPLEAPMPVTAREFGFNPVTPRVCCVIPCYNLAGVCGPIVRAAAAQAEYVIAINDGSTDETENVLEEVADEFGCRVQVLTFPRNRGKGIALLEAFRHALATMSFDVLVTLDGDGQHHAEDLPRLVRTLREGQLEMVIGERLKRGAMPLRSRLGNTLTAVVMKLFHPTAPEDTQSGFRAFHRDFVREISTTITGGRYETELEILLLALRQHRRLGSVTIPTIYLEGNRLSHFRPLVDSWRIYRTLIRCQLKSMGRPDTKGFPLGTELNLTEKPNA